MHKGWKCGFQKLHDARKKREAFECVVGPIIFAAPCTPALAHTSSLDTDLKRNTRAPHFTPQHWLLCHMGLYCSSSSSSSARAYLEALDLSVCKFSDEGPEAGEPTPPLSTLTSRATYFARRPESSSL